MEKTVSLFAKVSLTWLLWVWQLISNILTCVFDETVWQRGAGSAAGAGEAPAADATGGPTQVLGQHCV